MSSIIERFERFCMQDRPIKIYHSSTIRENGSIIFLIREKGEKRLVIICPPSQLDAYEDFSAEEKGKLMVEETVFEYRICPCNHHNAQTLRKRFSFTRPQAMGLTPALGTGDRIGLATPGHVRAVSRFDVFPVLAQQSIREMTRTARSPQEVLDDVSWAVFQEGYGGGFAADGDHLKTEKDMDETFNAGFTMYTIDPSDYVDNEADKYSLNVLKDRFRKLPWDALECREDDCYKEYLNKRFTLSTPDKRHVLAFEFSEETLLRAAVKYSAAIAHTVKLKRHLGELFGEGKFDLEMSVDETETPTSILEHFFIASELKRLEVQVQGLALRFVGAFEKAVDYVGNLEEFEKALRDHVLIARSCGPYKLSIHSGSDKFSIYPILGKLAGDLLHLKTAGTSYLEDLRVVARHHPSLFREIVKYSFDCFERDRRTYHISTNLSVIPSPDRVPDKALEKTFLGEDNARQLLHVTYGSILTAKSSDGEWLFRNRVREILIDNEEEHYQAVAAHLERHIKALGLKAK